MGNHTLTAATIVDRHHPDHAGFGGEAHVGSQMPHVITVRGADGANPTLPRLVYRESHGLMGQSVAKTPATIHESRRRGLARTGDTCTGDDQTLSIGFQVTRDLHDTV